jgi:hypothetical protein
VVLFLCLSFHVLVGWSAPVRLVLTSGGSAHPGTLPPASVDAEVREGSIVFVWWGRAVAPVYFIFYIIIFLNSLSTK